MAFDIADGIAETTTVSGTTSPFTLLGAKPGFRPFSTLPTGTLTEYRIDTTPYGGTDWETGIGTFTLSGTTLSRDFVFSSSNGNALVVFGSGTKDVFCLATAGDLIMGRTKRLQADQTTAGAAVTTLNDLTLSVQGGEVWSVDIWLEWNVASGTAGVKFQTAGGGASGLHRTNWFGTAGSTTTFTGGFTDGGTDSVAFGVGLAATTHGFTRANTVLTPGIAAQSAFVIKMTSQAAVNATVFAQFCSMIARRIRPS
jgi:hypothetical protein